MKRTMIVLFSASFLFASTAVAQSSKNNTKPTSKYRTKAQVKRKTNKVPRRPNKVPASKLKKKPVRNFKAMRDLQCLKDIE